MSYTAKNILKGAFAIIAVLVFAFACKSNTRPSDPTQNDPGYKDEDITENIDINDAKYNTNMIFGRLLSAAGDANNYYRFPVVATFGQSTNSVIVLYEERYNENGTGKDIGITGSTKVDIKYRVSTNYGNTLGEGTVGNVNASSDVSNSHGAPYLLVTGPNTVMVYATAGGGLYGNARIEYTTGTVNGNSISWSSWSNITVSNGNAATNLGSMTSNKFGTWSSVGKAVSSGNTSNYYLPVVYVDNVGAGDVQGENSSKWGVILLSSTDATNWKVVTNMSYDDKLYAESKIFYGGSGATLLARRKAQGGKPKTYTISSNSLTSSGDVAIQDGGYWSIFESAFDGANAWFINARGNESSVTLAKLGSAITSGSTHDMLIADRGKASSVAILGDGTILTAAEEGTRSGKTRDYNIVFRRFTQGYFNSHTKLEDREGYFLKN